MKRNIILIFVMAIWVQISLAQPISYKFDLKEIPFSYYGAYTAISFMESQGNISDNLFIRDISGKNTKDAVFRIEILKNGKPIKANYTTTPGSITAEFQGDKLEICYENADVIRLKGGLEMRLSFLPDIENGQVANVYTIPNVVTPKLTQFKLYRFWHNRFQFTLLSGDYDIKKDTTNKEIQIYLSPKNGNFEIALEEFQTEWIPRQYDISFDECKKNAQTEFNKFYQKMPDLPEKYREKGMQAAYINWSSVVKARDLMTRNGMLMSKNWMHNIWSWDHCFNAMALAYQMPEFSFDQFMVMFDHQDNTGGIPDAINDFSMLRGIMKPPVHGWAFKKMMNIGITDPDKMAEAYRVLTNWTNFWLISRDEDKNGIPQYNNGCDSGWDNATVFDIGHPTEGPDLSAFLVLQMDVLSEIANKLGKQDEAQAWKKKADQLLDKFINRCWNGENFVTKLVGTEDYNRQSQSLFNYLPIILGKRLPEHIRTKMIKDLKENGLITAFGPATENPQSPLYNPDGYWRGPIWAPSTMIIVDGLNACGEKKFATEIAQKFCDMCNNSGFGENFDALTGESLRDPAYTWTTSVFLILAHEYLK